MALRVAVDTAKADVLAAHRLDDHRADRRADDRPVLVVPAFYVLADGLEQRLRFAGPRSSRA